jgi:hypothetical protein
MDMQRAFARGLALTITVASLAVGGCDSDRGIGPDPRANAASEVEAEDNVAMSRHGGLGSCDTLRVPAGNRLVATLFARGDQVYRWDGQGWVFVEPAAQLYPTRHARRPVGIHYAGPTWESKRGSKVVGTVARRCTATSSAIPWLLLTAVSDATPGIFHRVTFIQRLHTVGGTAPSAAGTTVGEIRRVPYTADYAFYRKR